MKKISLIVMLCIFAALLSVTACATSLSDSLRIGNENYELLGGGKDDTVIRLYRGRFLEGFADGVPISELTDGDNVSEQIYMTRTKRGVTSYKTVVNGEAHDARGGSDAKQIYSVMAEPERVFKEKVEIDNVYCLDGDDSDGGIYIYFVTDKGDFVYYNSPGRSEREYLFPSDSFAKYARAALDARSDGGRLVSPDEINGAAEFEIKGKPDVLLTVACVLAVVGIAALCAVNVRMKRR